MSRKEKGYWTDARFIKACRYKSLKLFREEQRNLYSRIITKVCVKKPWPYGRLWSCSPTKEEVAEVAKQYKTRSEFKNEAPRYYNTAHLNKWVDEVCMHMPKLDRSPRGYWTKERVLETAKECGSYEAFAVHKAFFTARKRGWIEEVKTLFWTMKSINWTFSNVMREAQKVSVKNSISIRGWASVSSSGSKWVAYGSYRPYARQSVARSFTGWISRNCKEL